MGIYTGTRAGQVCDKTPMANQMPLVTLQIAVLHLFEPQALDSINEFNE